MQIDYASVVDVPSSAAVFHARQLRLDVFMTVHRTLEAHTLVVQRFRTLAEPSPSSVASHSPTLSTSSVGRSSADPSLQLSLRSSDEDAHCLRELDVRNVYGQPFEVALVDDRSDAATVRQRIVPGATVTLLLRTDRLALDPAHVQRQIPTPGGRQFVVAKEGSSGDEADVARELFWYREALLDRLSATGARSALAGAGRSACATSG